MILIFITCKNTEEAGEIGRALVKKRFAACGMVIPDAMSFYWWPPKKGIIEESHEAILLIKTIEKFFSKIEKEVKKMHSYEAPCILAIPVTKAHSPYLRWLKGEINKNS